MDVDKNHMESLANSYEEIYLDHEICIQPDRNPYRGGFEWSVCLAGVELDVGLDFMVADALKQARGAVAALTQTGNAL